MDYTTIHPKCVNQAHQVDLHLWRGTPINNDKTRPIQILVNNGYVAGFSPERLQPAWSAYRVAYATRDVKYDRILAYYNDMRLDEEFRIGRRTFGKIGGIQLNVGHMTPNEVITRQFGRLAQMETFFMSNMSPQYASLNSGVWLKLETAIRDIKDEKGKDHVWAIVGPIFGDNPSSISRGHGKHLPIPDSYFCVTVDPHSYPYDTPSRVHIDCFIIPQNAPRDSSPDDYPATLSEVEAATNLKFFKSWGREIPETLALQQQASGSESRLMKILKKQKAEAQPLHVLHDEVLKEAKTVKELIEALKGEVSMINTQDPPLPEEDKARLWTIQHTISWLHKAEQLTCAVDVPEVAREPANFITYKIVDDIGEILKKTARIACNFWNRFVEPEYSIVIRLGTFTSSGNTIARAYKPYSKDGVHYSKVEFNTKFLGQFTDEEIAGTIIHEIGHSLGIGWDKWKKLFDHNTGKFKPAAIRKLKALETMEVELDGGGGTALAHWDERKFDKELMTGYQDKGEYVLPVTINIMKSLGHKVLEKLKTKTDLSVLMEDAQSMVFSRQDEARSLNLEHYEETELLENIPHEDPEGGH
ncbi:MAG: DNA/RNA non-specific endonuclease [Bacteroidota bacterium]